MNRATVKAKLFNASHHRTRLESNAMSHNPIAWAFVAQMRAVRFGCDVFCKSFRIENFDAPRDDDRRARALWVGRLSDIAVWRTR
jgi:hypothetical protein